jgi:hypothetical protein
MTAFFRGGMMVVMYGKMSLASPTREQMFPTINDAAILVAVARSCMPRLCSARTQRWGGSVGGGGKDRLNKTKQHVWMSHATHTSCANRHARQQQRQQHHAART